MATNFYSDIYLNANKLGRDADNLLDFTTDNEITFRVGAGDGVVFKASGEIEATKFDGALEGNADTATTATTATVATTVTATINESAVENNVITFLANAEAETGNHGLEFDDSLTYNPSNGTVTSARFGGNLVGNADTATSAATLTTARTIGGVSFNGSANIVLPGVNAEGNQNTTGNAATATTATKVQIHATGTTVDGAVGGGEIVYFGGEEHTIAAGQLVHYNSNGNWEKANADASSTSDGLLGVALGGDASVNGVLVRGAVTIDHDPGAIGDVLYLSTTAGDCSATAPSGSGDIVRIIGYQINHASNGEIFFSPSADFILLA